MAELRKRADRGGKWFLDYRDPTNGRRYRVDTGTRNKRHADLWLRKAEDLISQARLGLIPEVGRIDADVIAGRKREEAPPLTLSEFRAVYEDRCRHDLEQAEKTIETNNLAFASFIRTAGDRRIDEVTDEDVRKWKRRLDREKKSKTTISMYHRALRAAFNRAIKWKLADNNPFEIVEVASWKKRDGREKDMEYDEVRLLLTAIDEEGEERFGQFIRFLLYSAARRNEILYLKVEDLDLQAMTMRIRSEKTDRDLDLPINKALRRVIGAMRLPVSGYIFTSKSTMWGKEKDKRPWNKDWVTHRFKWYIRKLGLPESYSLHSLRHTYATYLRKRGVPVDIVQKLLGHASSRTTSENYDHSIALHFRAQADLVDFESEEGV